MKNYEETKIEIINIENNIIRVSEEQKDSKEFAE